MKTYIVAQSHAAFDAVIRSMGIDRRDVVRIRTVEDTRGLTLQSEQVIYADGCGLMPDLDEIKHYLELALLRGESRSEDDKRTHRLTVTDINGGFIATRMVTARQAKDALG